MSDISREFWKDQIKDLIGFSPYQGFRYNKYTLYTTKFKKSEEKQKEISKGFHAYISQKEANYHLYAGANRIIVKMTIPAYTKYYKGLKGDIVSEIIITGTPR